MVPLAVVGQRARGLPAGAADRRWQPGLFVDGGVTRQIYIPEMPPGRAAGAMVFVFNTTLSGRAKAAQTSKYLPFLPARLPRILAGNASDLDIYRLPAFEAFGCGIGDQLCLETIVNAGADRRAV